MIWSSSDRVGVSFLDAAHDEAALEQIAEATSGNERIGAELLRLRAALDHVKVGIVLLDKELREQFINRAFRQMWRLPDDKADANPAFVALMYHACDTLAYEMPESELDAYVEERVADVKAGKCAAHDIRLRNGEVIRFQCVVLPDGGRMLSYTFVTDIVRHADQLQVLHAALDNVEQGVVLLDAQMNVQFMNRVVRRMWGVSDADVGRKASFAHLLSDPLLTKVYDVPPGELGAFVAERLASVTKGDSAPALLRLRLPTRCGTSTACSLKPQFRKMQRRWVMWLSLAQITPVRPVNRR